MPLDPFFSGAGLDRADLIRGDPDRLAELAARPAARTLRWADGLPGIDANGRLEWEAGSAPIFLGLNGNAPCFTALESGGQDLRAQFHALTHLHWDDAPVFAAAASLTSWHRRHGYCANCGHVSELVRGGWSRRCSACSAEHFPRVDPVVIMLAEHAGRLLLGRQPRYPSRRYSALAGFIEVGESIEAAVAREFHEEAGIAVRNVRYLASQPWPFPSSLMIGCHAQALDDRLTIDTTELEDARWFSREEVATALVGDPGATFIAPPPFAIARSLLEHWLALEESGPPA